jgi:glycosyltransferase involved in cell wall biosynthesis
MLNRKIRVGIDARCLNVRHLRGMGKALVHLLREGLNCNSVEFLLFADEPTIALAFPTGDVVKSRVWEVKGHRFRAWEQVGLPWMAYKTRCDILHCFGTGCSYWQPVPTVVTIHDVLQWTEEPPSFYYRKLLPAAYRKANAVITISQNSHNDIQMLWPDLATKTVTIPWGIGEKYLQPIFEEPYELMQQHNIRRPYLLYFGGEPLRKRLSWAINVWRQLNERDLSIVVCGMAKPRSSFQLDMGLTNKIICLPFISEDLMPSLIAGAAAVIYPTLYEGFGFPALEAQAVGTPVLMSAVGSLKELAGPGAILLPTEDLSQWVSACRRILAGDRPSVFEMRDWARAFSWASTFAKTFSLYESVIAGSGRVFEISAGKGA